MGLIKIKVLEYYIKPAYYRYMPSEIFDKLEEAFLDDEIEICIPKDTFLNMVDAIKLANWKFN